MKYLRSYNTVLLVIFAFLASCANLPYQAKPLDTSKPLEKFQQKSIADPAFRDYLLKQGYTEQSIPFKSWGLNELTSTALYFHPDLTLAKAKLALAESNIEISGLKKIPTFDAQVAHSNQANDDIRPWAFGLQVEIPIETSDKRTIRVEEAQHLAEVARMDIAETAWQLRYQLNNDLIDYTENANNIKLLKNNLAIYETLINLYNKRLLKGLASNVEVSKVKLLKQKSQFELLNEEAKTDELVAKLATDSGLTIEQFKLIPIKTFNIENSLSEQDKALSVKPNQLQEEALLNRIDIRRGIAKYAAAEAKIKLEVAKQTPDISLTPGIAFEYGDRIWSLGFASLINLLNHNPTYIKQAEQLRNIEGAQFESLQSSVIGDVSLAYAKYQAVKNKLDQSKAEQQSQLKLMEKLQKQFEAGLADRVELTQASLSVAGAEQMLHRVEFELLRTQMEIENLLQRPLLEPASKINSQIP